MVSTTPQASRDQVTGTPGTGSTTGNGTTSGTGGRFLANLRELRSKGEALRAKAHAREEASRRREVADHLKTLEEIGHLRVEFERLADQLVQEASGFESSCRLFDGRYLLEVRARDLGEDDKGRPRRWLSRLAFLVGAEGDELELECHKTVDDRDLAVDRARAPRGDAQGEEALKQFLKDQFLAFAEAYFARASRPVSAD